MPYSFVLLKTPLNNQASQTQYRSLNIEMSERNFERANEVNMNRKTLSESELGQAISSATNHGKWRKRNRLLLLMTHMSGIKRSELAALDIADVLEMSGEIKTKVKLPNRTLVLPKQLQVELKEYITSQFEFDSLAFAAYKYGDFPLFYTQKRSSFSPTTLSQTFTSIYERAGLKGATTKTGRQTWLDTLYARGANVAALCELAGQTRLAITAMPTNSALLRSIVEMI
jgi:integrase/recombinase XerD